MTGIGIGWYVGAFIMAIGLLVFVHELGHLLVAQLCGVRVLRFSIGFGKSLASWKVGRDQTVWSIAAIPLGGYVKMLDEREAPVAPDELRRAFNRQPVSRRMLIVAAGPAANLLLAVVLYWVMFVHGIQDIKPILGDPPRGSIAARAGIIAGESVTSVDGKPLKTWTDLRLAVLDGMLEHRSLVLETSSPQHGVAYRRLDIDGGASKDLGEDQAHLLGLRIYRAPTKPIIGSVVAGSPAGLAGLLPGDELIAIGARPVSRWDDVITGIQSASGRELSLEVLRSGSRIPILVTPQLTTEGGKPVGRIGIAVRQDPAERERMLVMVRYDAVAAISKAFVQTWETARLSLVMMGRMIVGEISLRNISGPVAIADYAGQSARLGLSPYLNFLALISISIGILNLLPIPVLDGGHLMYYLAESIKGSPVSERAQEFGQYIGFGVLGLLMAFALFNDINRLITS